MELRDFFSQNYKVAIAFSGGVDSSWLLYAAVKYGADVTAYYVNSEFQPEFELRDAVKVAEFIGAVLRVIDVSVLEDDRVRANPANRCYYCKQNILDAVTGAAAEDGYDMIVDGTNASDPAGDRPGMKALNEYGIRSPLRECGITKSMVRELSREAGLPVWDKPAYACLATRIPAGTAITVEALRKTERAEEVLYEMGFRDMRIRMRGANALVQVTAQQHDDALRRYDEIAEALEGMYDKVVIDEETR